jgi:formyltetrahydrofolate deformylase
MDWRIAWAAQRKRIAILVSKQDHCLQDLLWRTSIGELDGEIAAVISNHKDCAATVAAHGLRYHTLPLTPDTKLQQEQRLLEILAEAKVDLIVLARYMQILTEQVVAAYPSRIINIHHSFLPAFAGARPYHQAHERGVKLIGATAHYVTTDLDEGPIIAQATVSVSHRDRVDDLVRKGRDLERTTLATAVRLHLADKVLVNQDRTVVFE